MSIYDVLSCEVPIIAYCILRQPIKTVNSKDYANRLLDFRESLKEESASFKSLYEKHVSDFYAKSVQSTRGNLLQFLTTPIQTDTDEIQRILKDQITNTYDQLVPKTTVGLYGGYESKLICDSKHSDIPKSKVVQSRSSLQNAGFNISRNTSTIFESLYIVQGAINLDIIEQLIRKRTDISNTNTKKKDENDKALYSLYNLLFVEGKLELDLDKFELQVNFVKGNISYNIFNRELGESIKFFRKEIHSLNISVWQNKLGIGRGEEYNLRIRTKDRFTMRSAITMLRMYLKDKNIITDLIANGNWFLKEIL